MDAIVFQFSTSTAWQSAVIRRMCHSPFSHVDVVLEDGSCLGASDPGGVAIRPQEYQEFGIRRQAVIRSDKGPAILAGVKSQLGKPFDDGALYDFLSDRIDRNWRDPDKWFCSELMAWACESAGLWPFKLLIPKNRVSPADLLLLLNPFLDPDEFWQPVAGIKLGKHET